MWPEFVLILSSALSLNPPSVISPLFNPQQADELYTILQWLVWRLPHSLSFVDLAKNKIALWRINKQQNNNKI